MTILAFDAGPPTKRYEGFRLRGLGILPAANRPCGIQKLIRFDSVMQASLVQTARNSRQPAWTSSGVRSVATEDPSHPSWISSCQVRKSRELDPSSRSDSIQVHCHRGRREHQSLRLRSGAASMSTCSGRTPTSIVLPRSSRLALTFQTASGGPDSSTRDTVHPVTSPNTARTRQTSRLRFYVLLRLAGTRRTHLVACWIS